MTRRVLLVDDESRNLDLLEAHLGHLGYRLLRAPSGYAALQVFDSEGADLILLDVVMPGLDGIDVLTHIRSRTTHSRGYVPIILTTAHTDRRERLRGIEAGADEFLEKPIDRAILLARVRTLLSLKEARDDLAGQNMALERAHREVAARNLDLERLQREQRELTQFVIHDLKNPIAVAYTNVQWARAGLLPGQEDIAEALQDVEEATQRLQHMVDDLLVLARLEQSAFPLQREPIQVTALINQVVKLHGREARLKQLTIEVSHGDDAGALLDPTLIRRVIENLVENALRHTPPLGRIAISGRSDGEVEIVVSNTGQSIPSEDRGRIFEKFWRGSGAIRAGRAGLGLYFCRCVVEAHGGTIEVVDTPEWPTCFAVRLPSE